jgi:MFS family permease
MKTEDTVARAALSARDIRLSLAAVLISDFGVGILFGFQPPLIAFLLERAGHSNFMIGMVVSIGTLAVILLGPLYPSMLTRIGMRRSLVGGILLAVLLILAMPLYTGAPAWLVSRFLSGVGLGLAWIASEIWLNRLATDANRSIVMGLYATVFALGVFAGPLLLELTGTEGLAPFVVGALAVAVSVVPLTLVRHAPAAEPEHASSRGLLRVMATAPVVMLAALTAGLVESADLSLLPLFGLKYGLSETAALRLVSVFLVGNVILQLPIGHLADRHGRRNILSVCAVISTVGPLLLPLALGHASPWLWPVLFVWGGTMYSFYTQGIALIGDTYPSHELPTANTAFVMVYCAGGMLGPGLGGIAMDLWHVDGFVLLVASAALVLALGIGLETLRRRTARAA